METSATRPLRKDAQRNRERVLEAAREVFSRRGAEASLEQVAVRAEVGVGTVHRAFGSRAALVEAILVAELDDVAAFIDRCAAAPTGWQALCDVLWGLTELQLHNRALHDVVFASLDEAPGRVRERIERPLADIVDRARGEGRVRDDFTAVDIAVLSRAAAPTTRSTRSPRPGATWSSCSRGSRPRPTSARCRPRRPPASRGWCRSPASCAAPTEPPARGSAGRSRGYFSRRKTGTSGVETSGA